MTMLQRPNTSTPKANWDRAIRKLQNEYADSKSEAKIKEKIADIEARIAKLEAVPKSWRQAIQRLSKIA